MRPSRRTAATLALALVTALVAAGLALALTRSGQGHPDAQPTGIRPAATIHTVAGTRRAADHQAVLTAPPAAAGEAPSSPLAPFQLVTPLAPAPVPAASRGPPNLAVTVIN